MHKGIYKDKNGKWYIHTTYKGHSITIRGFDSKRKADNEYEYAIEKWKREHNVFAIQLQYEKVLEDFFEYRSKRVSHETLKKDKMYFKAYWNNVFYHQTLDNIFNIERLKIIYKSLCDDETISERKKYRIITCFNEFTSFCYMNNYITIEVQSAIKVLYVAPKLNRHSKTNKRYIPENDFEALINDIQRDNDNLFILAISVLYMGGLRISELLGLLGSDIDLSNKKIKVRRQLMTNGMITEQLKTSNSYRDVPINIHLFKNFELIKLNETRLFNYSHTEFRRKLSKYTDYTAHEFRHSFCTNLALKCTNISDVSYCAKVSGHTVSMFLNTYVKSMNKELENKFFN